jgi:hypothetical protein
LFRFYVAKVERGIVAYVAYVTSVSETCCKRLFKMFYLFLDVCCNSFLSEGYICFTHILQQYVPNVLVVSVLCYSKWFHVASCVIILMFHVLYTHVASVCF